MEEKVEVEKGLKLFGVRIVDWENRRGEEEAASDAAGDGEAKAIKKGMLKSKSMGNLAALAASSSVGRGDGDEGYVSDGGIQQSSRRRGVQERKRGVPWTEEEHRTFLAGLEKLGKGDWRGISRNFVLTRTPTQVASHAQKYFLRQNYTNKKKRRSSLFDVVFNNKTINTSVKRSDESLRTTVLSNNHLTEATSCSLVQTATPADASCSDITNLLKTSPVNPTTSILSLNPIVLPDQTAASFLKLSLPLRPPQPLVDSSTTVDGDLELSIAPPQSHGSLASMSAGSIRVV